MKNNKLLTFSLILVTAVITSISSAEDVGVRSSLKDPGVINEERIIYWSMKRGELKIDASEEEKDLVLAKYRKRAANGSYRLPGKLAKQDAKVLNNIKKRNAKLTLKEMQAKAGVNKTVKILAVLIDFPDLPFDDNRLVSGDTAMYYDSYPVSHYNDLIFKTDGYAGPLGQTLTTAHQYYQAESGGTLFLEGQAVGWVRADSNADVYGGNDPDTNASDVGVHSLVVEAVTKAFATGSLNLADFDFQDRWDEDGDGNLNEPDGIIDHVMIFHSSLGEEVSGGPIGDDAIWSHRHFVDYNTGGRAILDADGNDTGYSVRGYTIVPIDAAVGVVVHEFGHDLGVFDIIDEYNTSPDQPADDPGSPVGYWSLMASGSWAGNLAGSQPTGFSPFASNYFQQRFDGNWNLTTKYSVSSLTAVPQTVTLSEATNHAATNLIQVQVPAQPVDFFPPIEGIYQYYSGDGHLQDNSMSFDLAVPNATTVELTMKAHWNIEVDYDYAQVLVDGVAIAGNHTKDTNQFHPAITDFITDISANIAGASGTEGWVDLTFDMAAFKGQMVTITVNYVTDPAVGGYGIVIDDIHLMADAASVYADGAEDVPGPVSFNGFSKIKSTKPTLLQNYWVQMRSHSSVDAGLASVGYQRGMLVWFDDPTYSDNHVDVHPGHGFIGVVDAGQTFTFGSSRTQVKDATFSLYDGAESSIFDDSDDYTTPLQPESGMVLPRHGLSFSLQTQEVDSSSASILFEVNEVPWRAEFSFAKEFRTVTFTNDSFGTGNATYSWDFGDGSAASTQSSPVHTYTSSGDFEVTLTLTTEADGSVDERTQTVSIAELLSTSFAVDDDNGAVSFTSSTLGGEGSYTYSWDFGDGSASSSEANVTYTYAASGSYEVTLTVTSDDNQTATSSQTVDVYILPVAGYTVTKNNLAATFTNTSTGGDGNFTYAWDFGDGNTSTDASPSNTYGSAGTYTVALTVTDGQANSNTFSSSVSVSDPPVTPTPSKSGGGGSTGFFLFGLLLFARRFTKV